MSSISLVIPIKQLQNAKQRLSGVLLPVERSALFKAMIEDVLEVATICDRIDEVVIVTEDKEVTDLALQYSVSVMGEPAGAFISEASDSKLTERGLIAAVTYAGDQLAAAEIDVMIFLPGDVPLVSVEELEVVLDGMGRSGAPEVLIVPSNDLGGSNCVVCSPPNCLPFGFGKDSFRRHLRIAKEKGIDAVVVKLPGIGLDVDTPEDLITLAAAIKNSGLDNHTSRFLKENDIFHNVNKDEIVAG
ncbi:MAG: 2-phospho-L-lactate guanylyltransferase [Candidatus Azotimanducaceae bacterium]|jgi:2-phospho-L-lactate guanylyltransferase